MCEINETLVGILPQKIASYLTLNSNTRFERNRTNKKQNIFNLFTERDVY